MTDALKKNILYPAALIIAIAAIDLLILDFLGAGDYYFIPLSFTVISLYLSTFCLSKVRIIPLSLHRRIWNLALLATFLVCGATGILIVIRLDLRWDVPYMALLSFWHTETGIAMTLIAAFHALWHWRYYAGMLAGEKKKRGE